MLGNVACPVRRGAVGKGPHTRYLAGGLPYLVHRIIQRAYAGAAPTDAHEQVWAEECGSILAALEQWSDLHLSYQASGKPNTKAREAWLVSHPDYTTLAEHLLRYQAGVLGLYTWTQRATNELRRSKLRGI